MVERLRALVSGRVQGVGYRYFVLRQASVHEIDGLVRNLRSGQVEVVAEGERSRLENLIEDLHKGPYGADVSGVQIVWENGRGDFHDFSIEN